MMVHVCSFFDNIDNVPRKTPTKIRQTALKYVAFIMLSKHTDVSATQIKSYFLATVAIHSRLAVILRISRTFSCRNLRKSICWESEMCAPF